MAEKEPVIGIDLGTTYSCVGIWQDCKVEIIANDQGNRKTPSYVAFSETERLIGEAAKNQSARNPTNTVYDVKRLIGRKYNDPRIQKDIKLWPFQVISGQDEKPLIQVKYQNETKNFHPEEISSMVLGKMRENAESFLGKPVKNAVISVPAQFNDSQRQATIDAGQIAGLNVLRVINEPTAAAIAFEQNIMKEEEELALIFDLGGGKLDVTLLGIVNGVFEVKATAGDTHLGGEDFDAKLVEFCMAELLNKHGIDISQNKKSIRRLLTQCERAKRILSSANQTTIEVDALVDNEDFSVTITRAKFEELCMPMFQQCISLVEKVLKDIGISKNQIHEVVLCGGSTRIPKVVELLKDYFNGKEPNKFINPDEAVAYGATVWASIVTGQRSKKYMELCLLDVAPISLNIENPEGFMTVLFPRNTCIPMRESLQFTTLADNQSVLTIQMYEGEGKLTKDCHKLGQFDISGIAPAAKGVPIIDVTFDIDANGILHVHAEDESSKELPITNHKGRLSKEDIEKLVKDAEKFKGEDEAIRAKIDAKNSLEQTNYSIKNTIKDEKFKDKFTSEEKTKLEHLVEETQKWIDANPNAEADEYKNKLKALEEVFHPIMQKVYAQTGGAPEARGESGKGSTVDQVD